MLPGLLGTEELNYWLMTKGWLRPPPRIGQVDCLLKMETVGISPLNVGNHN